MEELHKPLDFIQGKVKHVHYSKADITIWTYIWGAYRELRAVVRSVAITNPLLCGNLALPEGPQSPLRRWQFSPSYGLEQVRLCSMRPLTDSVLRQSHLEPFALSFWQPELLVLKLVLSNSPTPSCGRHLYGSWSFLLIPHIYFSPWPTDVFFSLFLLTLWSTSISNWWPYDIHFQNICIFIFQMIKMIRTLISTANYTLNEPLLHSKLKGNLSDWFIFKN